MLAPIDVVNSFNRPTGRISDPEEANNKGYWHRGAHAFIITPKGRILVQKRGLTTIQRPGMIDIGVGGFVDSGELPEQAAVREIKEETGLDVTPGELIFLGTTRYNHRWKFKNRQKITRAIIYNYAVRLPHEHNHVTPEQGEVEWVGFVPARSAFWLIRHKTSRLGRLSTMYAYYRIMVGRAYRILDQHFY
ncbi:MAG TPA: NUDIX domain-containing protein [Candidatus Saccharimonadales bacterium]|nr:NUDIX domain-containing protein [Candidatus Saccharimonadales bacterium]